MGSVVGAALIWILYSTTPALFLSDYSSLLFIAVPTLVSILICNAALKLRIYGDNVEDPQQIVIDEIAGMFATVGVCLYSGFGLLQLIFCFGFFRLFDILKPFPISRLERLSGGTGITLDDTAAGILAGLIVFLIFSV
jgi:phosphatidylglycerophosphatase A